VSDLKVFPSLRLDTDDIDRAFTISLLFFAIVGVIAGERTGQIVLKDDKEYEDNPLAGPGLVEKDREQFDEV
jgi:hypothetical protein